ncbi:type II toxin-antitoxin system RelE/ParE family toxin [Methanotrichaceae archaeon M04Ac]|uniref:Type II toxin-antitoxin system RelE/ParE family toxin n=1 Tax=Candidatus Methanocrinis alkalitolerans TaxID=3033395 RepID=A0ABT5XGB5_9EURY|nr:type II toxin-antitoxin system RelE/ParE family toxin [Candidatus Methanocrinis alkalitolerans]MCR3883399.1 type II toxin-antitoxin system RelE/ParE family toxin [Methanothrix sp.]MDF0593668.1 type II toxin-antitoxin system RelE/ParE family toxin [Candidatus Methanocrinis alkalitolerans]
MTYQLLIEEKALEFLRSLPEKSRRLVAERCLSLADDPFPGSSSFDREALHLPGFKKLYRLHVGRSYTVFYRISEDEKVVGILAVTIIEKAHKMYGRL